MPTAAPGSARCTPTRTRSPSAPSPGRSHQVVEEATQIFPATVVPRDFDLITMPFPERGEPELVRSGARLQRKAADAAGTLGEPIL